MTDDQGYIIEFHRIGNAVKVTAMDPATLTEVSIVGAPGIGDADLTRLVVRKLEYVLAKRGTNSGKANPRNG
jgi:phage head maturation protease